MHVFRDGSLAEGALMRLLLAGWVGRRIAHMYQQHKLVHGRTTTKVNVFLHRGFVSVYQTYDTMDGEWSVRMIHWSLTYFWLLLLRHSNNNSVCIGVIKLWCMA